MGQYRIHCFVCTSGKVCPRQGSQEVLDALRIAVKDAGLAEEIRINHSGCMAQCGHGPMVVIYPEDVWYAAVRACDVPELIASHFAAGRPVERLRHHPPGPGKQICPKGRETIPPAAEPSP